MRHGFDFNPPDRWWPAVGTAWVNADGTGGYSIYHKPRIRVKAGSRPIPEAKRYDPFKEVEDRKQSRREYLRAIQDAQAGYAERTIVP